jgi:hypothetical protein
VNICVLGNSHVAALKTGLDQLGEPMRRRWQVAFFASPGKTLSSFAARQGRLATTKSRIADNVAHTSGGLAEVDPADHDLFLLHGLLPACCYEIFTPRYLSTQFVQRHLAAAWAGSVARELHAELRHLTDKPIVISAQPLLSDTASRVQRAVQSSPTMPADTHQLFAAQHEVWGKGTFWLPQPSCTTAGKVFTLHSFSEGSTRLEQPGKAADEAHRSVDQKHMNASYGAALWEEFAGRLPGWV